MEAILDIIALKQILSYKVSTAGITQMLQDQSGPWVSRTFIVLQLRVDMTLEVIVHGLALQVVQ